ncbi:osmoprotectant transporter permease [Spirosoma sp. SC4-14]|uniref:osmoprotectant transporter permease n=1 Tax=Spirosoma sp. SC4-14 TaxID=3128900 RepID=UPI0030CA664B
MTFFWILWAFDAIIALIIFYFFFIGLADGTVSSFNAGLWFFILAAVGVIMIGSYWLQTHQYGLWAKVLLSVLAIPGALYGLFILLILITNPRWN